MPLTITEAEAKIEALTREVERLKGLDTVVSHAAHKLNTPLGAMFASLDLIDQYLPEYTARFIPLLRKFSAEEQAAFQAFAMRVYDKFTHRTTRAIRHELLGIKQLLANRIPDAESVAQQLQESRITDAEDIDKLLVQPHMAEMLEMLAYRGNIYSAIYNLGASAVLIRDYLNFLSLGRGEQLSTDRAKPKHLKNEAESVLDSFPPDMLNGVQVSLDIDPGLTLYADPMHLRQLLLQLIGNSVHALKKKGVLQLRATVADNCILLEVVDNGPGIPPDLQPNIFTPLVTTRNQGEGSGLGLYIAKKITETYGGEISFTSSPMQTVFVLRWPLSSGPS